MTQVDEIQLTELGEAHLEGKGAITKKNLKAEAAKEGIGGLKLGQIVAGQEVIVTDEWYPSPDPTKDLLLMVDCDIAPSETEECQLELYIAPEPTSIGPLQPADKFVLNLHATVQANGRMRANLPAGWVWLVHAQGPGAHGFGSANFQPLS
jgi:hypothetical protein